MLPFFGFIGSSNVLLKMNKTLALQCSILQKQICPVFSYSLEYYLLHMEESGVFAPPRRRYRSLDVQSEKRWLIVCWKHVDMKPSISVTQRQGNTAGVWVSFSFCVIVFL